MFFIFSFKIYVLLQQKNFNLEAFKTYELKYENFQITKFSSCKKFKKKVKKSASEEFCVCLTDIYHCLESGTINLTHLFFTATAWVQFQSSASHLTLKKLNFEFVAQTETLKYNLPQIITPNGKKTSHLSLISRVHFYCTNKCR